MEFEGLRERKRILRRGEKRGRKREENEREKKIYLVRSRYAVTGRKAPETNHPE